MLSGDDEVTARSRRMGAHLLGLGDDFAPLIDDGHWPGGIEAVWPPQFDEERCCVTVGRLRGWLVGIIPMVFNDRLVLSPQAHPFGYDHGWCYPKGVAAVLAVATWHVQYQREPSNYLKHATSHVPVPQLGEHAR